MEFKSSLSKKCLSLMLINALSISAATNSYAEESSWFNGLNIFSTKKAEIQIPKELQEKALKCKTTLEAKTNTEKIVDELFKVSEDTSSESKYFLLNKNYFQACEQTSDMIKKELAELEIAKTAINDQDNTKQDETSDLSEKDTGNFTLTKRVMYGTGSDRFCAKYITDVKLSCIPQHKYDLSKNSLTGASRKNTINTGSDYTYFIKALFPSSQEDRDANLELARNWNKFQQANANYISGDYFITDKFTRNTEQEAKESCLRKLNEYKNINKITNFRINREGAALFVSNGKQMSSSFKDFDDLAKQSTSDINFSISKPSENSKYNFFNHANFNCSISRSKEFNTDSTLTRIYMDYDMDKATSFCYNHPNRIGNLNSLHGGSDGEEGSFFKYFNFEKMDLKSNDPNLVVNTYYNELEAPVFATDLNKNNYYSAPYTVDVVKLQKIKDGSMIFNRLLLDFNNKKALVITYNKSNPNYDISEVDFFNTAEGFVRSTYWKNHKDDWKNWTDDTSYNDKPGVRSLKIFGLGNCVYQD